MRLPFTGATIGADPVRATILAAAIPSLASLVLTAWSLMDALPESAPWGVGLAAGVVLDIALVSAVAIAWVTPAVAKPAQVAGWLIAALAAGLVGWHSWLIDWPLMALGLIPLAAKGLWGLALQARLARLAQEAEDAEETRAAEVERERQEAEQRRAAEQEQARRAAELATDLTHDQQAEIARRRRDAAYARELSDAQRDLDDATAEAAHQAEMAKIRRAAEQQRALEREQAEVVKERQALVREIQAGRGLALEVGDTPDDLTSLPDLDASLMGFGSARPRELEPRLRELLEYVAAAEAPSVRGAARALGVDAATIRRRRDELTEQGYNVSALKRTQQ
ncbi:hypothetical protein [Streptomonospora wellingtoniae]|uniref:DUF2637 domain-containing protein n=1 Tax=Streptomonospora wellingtoniae TaxID=3075544 RepID=A0ABU2L0F5_9ACTN|nr:hypothetical protein [Streptomonospora sp. DSM 45055]MDT0305041.1 hypothetical protein [Streptomonospora sp. DSM 45055]